MSDSETRYDAWHAERYGHRSRIEPDDPWHLMALRHVGDVRGKRVLEVACGPGQFARWLAEQGADVVAGDFSREACAIAKRVCGDSVDVRQLDVQNLVEALGENSFDVVISLETLEHVQDHDRALRELVAVARPGGRILVSTPNYFSFVGVYRLLLRLAGRRFTELGQPVNKVTVGFMRTIKLKRLGCSINAVEGAVHHFPVPKTKVEIPFRFMERPAFRYLARHVLVVATKGTRGQ